MAIGKWDNSNCVFALAPNSWSKGNGTSNQNTGEFPGYPAGTYNATLTNMASGYGYIYNSGDGYFNFDGSNDYITTTLNPSWTNASVHTFEFKIRTNTGSTQALLTQYDDANNLFQCGINASSQLFMTFIIGGTTKFASSLTTISNSTDYTLTYRKNGAALQLFIDGNEVTYNIQNTYTFGTKSFTQNVHIGIRADGVPSFPWADRIYSAVIYDVALSESQIKINAGLPNSMGFSGDNSVSSDTLVATRYQTQFLDDAVFVLPFNAWSKGNGTNNKFSAELPAYPNGDYNPTCTNMTTGYGYQYNAGDGYCNFDGSNDAISSILNPSYSDASTHTWEVKFIYNQNVSLRVFLEQLSLGDLNNYFTSYVAADGTIGMSFRKSSTSKQIISSTALTDTNEYTIHFVKNGTALKAFINGVEVQYATQDTYNHGNTTYTPNMYIGGRNSGAATLEGFVYWVSYYDTALTSEQIKQHYANDNDMGLVAVNYGDTIQFEESWIGTPYSNPYLTPSFLTYGMVAAWLFNEGGGYVLNDSSGYGNDAHLYNEPVWTGGPYGTSLQFEASNSQYGDITDILNDVSSDTRGTIMFGFSFDTQGTYRVPISFSATDDNERLQLQFDNNDKFTIVCVDAGTTKWRLDADAPLSAGEYVAALVQDGTSPVLYLNGEMVSQTFIVSTDTTVWLSDLSNVDRATIGAIQFNSGAYTNFFDNKMHFMYYYDRPLSQYEISMMTFDPFSAFRSDAAFEESIAGAISAGALKFIPHKPELRSRRPWKDGYKWGIYLPKGKLVNKYDYGKLP